MADILRTYLIQVRCAHCNVIIGTFEIEAPVPEIIRWAVCCDHCQYGWRKIMRERQRIENERREE